MYTDIIAHQGHIYTSGGGFLPAPEKYCAAVPYLTADHHFESPLRIASFWLSHLA
jgi:hypothetical protein